MGDDLFKPQDQATENPQPVEEAQHVLREISEAELRKQFKIYESLVLSFLLFLTSIISNIYLEKLYLSPVKI